MGMCVLFFKFSSLNSAAGPVNIHTDRRDIKERERVRRSDALSDRNMRVQNVLVPDDVGVVDTAAVAIVVVVFVVVVITSATAAAAAVAVVCLLHRKCETVCLNFCVRV